VRGPAWTTDLNAALGNSEYSIYFDAQTTGRRADAIARPSPRGSTSIARSRLRDSLESALDLWKLAEKAGVKHGVVQDKLWLPGLLKLETLKQEGFFGRILSVRGEFGYWSSKATPWRRSARRGITARKTAAASSWTCYALALRAGQPVRRGEGRILFGRDPHPRRWNEAGEPFDCTAEDAGTPPSS